MESHLGKANGNLHSNRYRGGLWRTGIRQLADEGRVQVSGYHSLSPLLRNVEEVRLRADDAQTAGTLLPTGRLVGAHL